MTVLDKIVEYKKEFVAACKSAKPLAEVRREAEGAPAPRDMLASLRQGDGVHVIAECKKASPSKGVIRPDYDPAAIARSYAMHGAAAISCLTDEKFFQGSLDHLRAVRAAVDISVMRKEFIIDEYQIYEARAAGADAALLICSILDEAQLRDFTALLRELGMHALVEIYDPAETPMALRHNTGIVGVNNRDLRNFEVDLRHTATVAKEVGDSALLVSESGIFTPEDVAYIHSAGAKAILVGEAFMRAEDPGIELKYLIEQLR
ncbi:indole-3-glycerol phosphate synthase TrpC [Candidatus Sumerlaeota bacterium]|nr:indole-3-glycerol phosphate synthase TrpC [Candidatus Sumerlaeota bacterium]